MHGHMSIKFVKFRKKLRVKIMERTRQDYPVSTQSGLTSTLHISFQYIDCIHSHRLATMLVYGLLYINNTAK